MRQTFNEGGNKTVSHIIELNLTHSEHKSADERRVHCVVGMELKIRLNLIHRHDMCERAVLLARIDVYVPFIGKFCANAYGLHCVEYDKAFVIRMKVFR